MKNKTQNSNFPYQKFKFRKSTQRRQTSAKAAAVSPLCWPFHLNLSHFWSYPTNKLLPGGGKNLIHLLFCFSPRVLDSGMNFKMNIFSEELWGGEKNQNSVQEYKYLIIDVLSSHNQLVMVCMFRNISVSVDVSDSKVLISFIRFILKLIID